MRSSTYRNEALYPAEVQMTPRRILRPLPNARRQHRTSSGYQGTKDTSAVEKISRNSAGQSRIS
jgi:hypothetical protein